MKRVAALSCAAVGIVGAANIARQFCRGVAASPAIAVVAVATLGIVRAAAAIATPGRLAVLFALLVLSIPWRMVVVLDAARGTVRNAPELADDIEQINATLEPGAASGPTQEDA